MQKRAYSLFRRYNCGMEKTVRTLAEFEVEAGRFASELAPSPRGAVLVALSGELGAGKTAFTKVVAKILGVEQVVTSPTFVLEKIYQLPAPLRDAGFSRLVHIDAYRLESGESLSVLDFDELMRDARSLIMLEWPEMVSDTLPKPTVRISIVAQPDGSRIILYD